MGGRDEQALTLDSALVRNDERAYLTHRLLTLSAADTSTFIYPRLFAVHTLSGAVGCQGPHGQVVLPPTLSLTADKLDGSGAFLLDNGETLMLWLGAEVARSFLTHKGDMVVGEQRYQHPQERNAGGNGTAGAE